MMLSTRVKGILVFATFVVCLVAVVAIHLILAGTSWEGTSVVRTVASWSFLPCALSLLVGAVTVFDMLVVQRQQAAEVAQADARVREAEERHRTEHEALLSDLAARTTAVEVLNTVIAQERNQFAETKKLNSRLCTLVRDAVQCASECDSVRADTEQQGTELDAVLLAAVAREPLVASDAPADAETETDTDTDGSGDEDEEGSVLQRCELQTKIQQNEQEVCDLESELQALFAHYVEQHNGGAGGATKEEEAEAAAAQEGAQEAEAGAAPVDTSESAIAEDVGRRGDRSATLGALERALGRVGAALRAAWARRRALTECVVLVLRENRVLKRGLALRAAQVAALARVTARTETTLQRQLLDASSTRELLESRMRRHLTDSEVQVQLLRETVLRKTARVIELEACVAAEQRAAGDARADAAAAAEGRAQAEARCAALGLTVLTLEKALRDLEKVLTEKDTALLCSDDQNRTLAATASSQAQDIVALRAQTFRAERALLAARRAETDGRAARDALQVQLRAAEDALAQQRADAHGLAQRVAALQDALDGASRRRVDDEARLRQELHDATAALHREITAREEVQRELDLARSVNAQLLHAQRSTQTPRACSAAGTVDNNTLSRGAAAGACAGSAGPSNDGCGDGKDDGGDDDDTGGARKKGLGSPCSSGVSGSVATASSSRA